MTHRSQILASLAVFAAVTSAGLGLAQVARNLPEQKDFRPGEPVKQPLPYSHKLHVGMGLKCTACHTIEPPGDYAGYPPESKCMACHNAVKKDSPHIAKLAEAARAGKPIEWERVYRVKDFVYFSHAIHAQESRIACQTCHGPVETREVLFQETSLDMYWCMKCHEQTKAPNQCEVCHDTH